MRTAAHTLGALSLLSTATLPLAAAERELPERFEATFLLEAAGTTVARARWSSAPGEGGRYVSTSHTEPVGMLALIRKETRTERSEWTWAGDWLQPLAYEYERTGRKARRIRITFDWKENMARHDSPGAVWRLAVPPGVLDKFNYMLALMRDLGRGERRVEYTIADGGRRLKRYVLSGIGEERIETALGTLDTVVVRRERKDSRRQTTLWCASALHFLPVKIVQVEPDGRPVTLRIDSLDGIERREP